MPMEALKRIAAVVVAAVGIAGCKSSPYDYYENWLLREDAIRSFAVPADIIYVQSDLYTHMAMLPTMYSYVNAEVGNKKFYGLARVFAPLVATQEDMDKALGWYFRRCHQHRRPFVFIGEGEGGKLLRAYEEKYLVSLKGQGLVASFYTDDARKGFVTVDMVRSIKIAIAQEKFKSVWGKDMPAEMFD